MVNLADESYRFASCSLIEFVRRLSGLSGGTHRIELHDVIGNDEHVVALHTTRAERGGRKLEINAAQIFHVRDGC